MKRKTHTATFTAAAGTALLAALALAPAASAVTNPFAAIALHGGYMVADSMGTPMKSTEEAKCGADKAKQAQPMKGTQEAQCGADKKAAPAKEMKEAKCGADKSKS